MGEMMPHNPVGHSVRIDRLNPGESVGMQIELPEGMDGRKLRLGPTRHYTFNDKTGYWEDRFPEKGQKRQRYTQDERLQMIPVVVAHDNTNDWDLEDWVGILMILGMCIGILIGIYT